MKTREDWILLTTDINRVRKGRMIFLVLAVLGTIWVVVLALSVYRSVLISVFFAYYFMAISGEPTWLAQQLFMVTAPFLQTALFIFMYFGKGWARVTLTVYFGLHALVGAFWAYIAWVSAAMRTHSFVLLFISFVFCLVSFLILANSDTLGEYISARKEKRRTGSKAS
ncbi:MAG: hypothetical protein LBI19_06385 [Oscillospiraceae bacterium]|jgi:hypothetical protein|nr:hypothetical protein [Oscillospiraceae bacterium]